MEKFVANKVATYCIQTCPYFWRYSEKPHRNNSQNSRYFDQTHRTWE